MQVNVRHQKLAPLKLTLMSAVISEDRPCRRALERNGIEVFRMPDFLKMTILQVESRERERKAAGKRLSGIERLSPGGQFTGTS